MQSTMQIKSVINSCFTANALNLPPGDYDRKIEILGNWRELLQAVEYVV